MESGQTRHVDQYRLRHVSFPSLRHVLFPTRYPGRIINDELERRDILFRNYICHWFLLCSRKECLCGTSGACQTILKEKAFGLFFFLFWFLVHNIFS